MDRKARERNWFDWSIERCVTPRSFPGVSKYISLSFQWIWTNLVSTFKLGYAILKTEKNMKIKQKTFALLLIKCRYFFGTPGISNIYRNIVSIIFHCASRALSDNSAGYDVTLYVTMFQNS